MTPLTVWQLLAIVAGSFVAGTLFTAVFAYVAGKAWVQNVEDSREFGKDCADQGNNMFKAGLKMLAKGTAFYVAARRQPDKSDSPTPGLDAVANHVKRIVTEKIAARRSAGLRISYPSDMLPEDEDGFVPDQVENPHMV